MVTSASRQRTHVYVLTGSFSADSGGRTRSSFLKAGALAGPYGRCSVLTFNWRLNYGEIARDWLRSVGAPANVQVENFYEYLAAEPLFGGEGPGIPFEAPAGAVRNARKSSWDERASDGSLVRRHVLREDGSLNYVDEWSSGTRLRHLNADRFGSTRVVSVVRPGAKDYESRERRTPDGRVFADERIDEQGGVTVRVVGGPADTGGAYVPVKDLQFAWIRFLHDRAEDAVFLSEARAYDRHVAVVNPYLPPGGLRTIATVHSNHLRAPYADVHSVTTYNDWALSHARDFGALVVLTQRQRDDVLTHYGPSPTVVTIGHPVAPSPRPRLRTLLHAAVARPPRIVGVTRLAQVKRLDHVLRAFKAVRRSVPEARLEIWGSGPEEAALNGLAGRLKLKKVRFAGRTADPLAAFRRGQVSVSTSLTEGFGMSTLESLSAGTPVVAYDYRYGPGDLLADGRNGYLVPDGDVDELARRLVDVLSRPRRARVMGAWASTVRLTRSRRRWLKRWVAVIDSTARSRAVD